MSASIQRDVGTATIEYDPSVVSPDDLVEVVSGVGHVHGNPDGYQAAVAD